MFAGRGKGKPKGKELQLQAYKESINNGVSGIGHLPLHRAPLVFLSK